jgi:hypothetical protein
MGRTIPSFKIALAMDEESGWNKPFRNALDKLDRKKVLMGCFMECLASHPAHSRTLEEIID